MADTFDWLYASILSDFRLLIFPSPCKTEIFISLVKILIFFPRLAVLYCRYHETIGVVVQV